MSLFPTQSVKDSGDLTLTAEQAGALLATTRYEHQDRDLTKSGRKHRRDLGAMMQRGTWRSRSTLDFARLNGNLILMNGHHRLGSQAESGCPITWSIVVHECDTAEAVHRLYYTFDTHLRIRTDPQVLNSLNLPERLNLPKTIVTAAYQASSLLAADMNTGQQDEGADSLLIEDKVEIVTEFKPQLQLIEKWIKPASAGMKFKLRQRGAFAVAMVTAKHQPARAEAFWSGIAQDDGLKKGDPRHTYLRAMLEPDGRHSGSSWYSAAAASLSWNRFFEGRDLGSLKKLDVNPTISVLGTPFARAEENLQKVT
jgi:hypothetical protein